MSSTSSLLILTRVATFVYGGILFALTKTLDNFFPVSYLLCACWWQVEKPCTICCVVGGMACHEGILEARSMLAQLCSMRIP
jgi:hypothetical protein